MKKTYIAPISEKIEAYEKIIMAEITQTDTPNAGAGDTTETNVPIDTSTGYRESDAKKWGNLWEEDW